MCYLVTKVSDYYPLSCLAYNVLQRKEAAEEWLDHCKFHSQHLHKRVIILKYDCFQLSA